MNTRLKLLQICLLVFCVMAGACPKGERARAMEAELKGKIENAFANGGDRTAVEAFIDKLEVNGARPAKQPFTNDLTHLGNEHYYPPKPKTNPQLITGYVLANFGRVDSDATVMHYVHLHAVFFFNAQDRLVEYRTYLTYHD